jgi:two-component system chemotaxis sensor kinase CheA
MRPGFSTASEVTHTSGRGVGMDVVKDNIEKLNGTIDIVSTIGAGVTFRIKIPLTLAIIPALLVRVQSELFTIPLPTVDETLRIKRDEISTIEGMEVYYLRENTVPLIRLAELFSMRQAAADPEELFVVIINTGARQVGLIVDELRAREEVVIKPLEDYLQEKSGFSGATILGDGSISLILDVYELVQLALGRYAIRSSTATA